MGSQMATKRHVKKTQKAKARPKKFTTKERKRSKKQKIGLIKDKVSYQKSVPSERPDAPTYEEVVLRNIVNNSKKNSVPDEAFLMSSTLSSLSGGMKELHYRSGFSIGKALYKINNSKSNYMFPEESVADLVGFFESVGHKYIMYSSYPGSIELKMHDKKIPGMGTNLHSFEAGIISGYLSTAERRYVNVVEESCVNDAGQYCKFSTNYKGEGLAFNGGNEHALEKLVDHVAEKIKTSHGRQNLKSGMSNEYYLLSSSIMFDKEYIESMKSIASYMGKSLGAKLFASNGKAPSNRTAANEIERTIRMLNLGNPTVKGTKPLHISISFDRITSKKEFVDVSLSFINGLLSDRLDHDAVATERSNRDSYVVEIKELKN
jgi:predicted hydrocarbon binding protein